MEFQINLCSTSWPLSVLSFNVVSRRCLLPQTSRCPIGVPFLASWRVLLTSLPPHSFLFSLQVLNMTRRHWSDPSVNGVGLNDFLSLAAVVCIWVEVHTGRDPLLPLPNLLTSLAAVLGRRQPHSVPQLHAAWALRECVSEESRMLQAVNFEVGV